MPSPLKLHYEEFGSLGTPIVLLHGFPLDSRIWLPVAIILGKSHRVIVPDLRGFGRSTNPGEFTLSDLARDLHQLLASLHALPCILAGLSMGGYVAFTFLEHFASSLAGLILVDTKADADSPQGKAARVQTAALAMEKGASAVVDQMLPKMTAPDAAPETLRALRVIMDSCPAPTIAAASRAMMDRSNRLEMLPQITLPTLVIVGAADAIAPEPSARTMAGLIPRSHLALILDAGHMAPFEQPAAVADAINTFLRDSAVSSTTMPSTPLTFAAFQKHISEKYEAADRARGSAATFLWFIEEVGELATGLHGTDRANLEEEFADVLAWLCTLANINDIDLAAAVHRKYLSTNPPAGHK